MARYTKTDFVSSIKDLYSEIRAVGGSIIFEGDNRTRTDDDDPPGFKPSVMLAWEMWDRFDPDTCEYLAQRIREYVKDARFCHEAQKGRFTRDKNARCRPIVEIDELGSPICDWRK